MQIKLTGKPEVQAIPGTTYAYAKMSGWGKCKCVGMIKDSHRDFYAEHFAGQMEQKPTCPMGVQLGDSAVLIFTPEYVGDQQTEEDLLTVNLCVYRAGKRARA